MDIPIQFDWPPIRSPHNLPNQNEGNFLRIQIVHSHKVLQPLRQVPNLLHYDRRSSEHLENVSQVKPNPLELIRQENLPPPGDRGDPPTLSHV